MCHVAFHLAVAKYKCVPKHMIATKDNDLDGKRPHWIIPRLRTKNKKTAHTVPLPPTGVRLIGEALAISKKKLDEDGADKSNDQAVFASRFEDTATIARHSLSQGVLAMVRDKELSAIHRRRRKPKHYCNERALPPWGCYIR